MRISTGPKSGSTRSAPSGFEAVSQIEGTRSGVVTEDPEKGIALTDGDIEEALTDTSSPVRLPDVDGVQLEPEVDPRFGGRAGYRETDHAWPLDRNRDRAPAGDPVRHISRNRLIVKSSARRAGASKWEYASRQHSR
jgi:hypothetical protein